MNPAGCPVVWEQRGKMAALWRGGREGRWLPCDVAAGREDGCPAVWDRVWRRLWGRMLRSVKGGRRCGSVTTYPTGEGSQLWGWRPWRRAPLEAACVGLGLSRRKHPPQGHRRVMEHRRVSRGCSYRKEQASLASETTDGEQKCKIYLLFILFSAIFNNVFSFLSSKHWYLRGFAFHCLDFSGLPVGPFCSSLELRWSG